MHRLTRRRPGVTYVLHALHDVRRQHAVQPRMHGAACAIARYYEVPESPGKNTIVISMQILLQPKSQGRKQDQAWPAASNIAAVPCKIRKTIRAAKT